MWVILLISFYSFLHLGSSSLVFSKQLGPEIPTSKPFLKPRTSIHPWSCDGARNELIDYLRRVSDWADNAILAVSFFSQDLAPAVSRQNRRDFRRIFRLQPTPQNRMWAHLAYQAIRDETSTPLRDRQWQDTGHSRLTLECEVHRVDDGDCNPFGYGREDYARSTGEHYHLLLCPPFFELTRRLPRNEIEHSRVTVLMQELFYHFPVYLQGRSIIHNPNPVVDAYKLTRFATAIALRRYAEPPGDDVVWQIAETRMRLVDQGEADPDESLPDIEAEDWGLYEGETYPESSPNG